MYQIESYNSNGDFISGHKVLATSHIQYDPYSTTLMGISAAGSEKLRKLKFEQHLFLRVIVGGRSVKLNDWYLYSAKAQS